MAFSFDNFGNDAAAPGPTDQSHSLLSPVKPNSPTSDQSKRSLQEVEADNATIVPIDKQGDPKKSRSDDAAALPNNQGANSSFADLFALFGDDPEAKALLRQKQEDEERTKIAKEAAEKAAQRVTNLKPELKSLKQESAKLLSMARQKFMNDLKEDAESKKREREEAEKHRLEAERIANVKGEKLEKKRKEVEQLKNLEFVTHL